MTYMKYDNVFCCNQRKKKPQNKKTNNALFFEGEIGCDVNSFLAEMYNFCNTDAIDICNKEILLLL
jgi:hypothetical protein